MTEVSVAGKWKADIVLRGHFDTTFDLNARAMLFTAQKALPLMPDGASIIVLVVSIAGSTGTVGYGAYGATKAAMPSFARPLDERIAAASDTRQCG